MTHHSSLNLLLDDIHCDKLDASVIEQNMKDGRYAGETNSNVFANTKFAVQQGIITDRRGIVRQAIARQKERRAAVSG